MRIAAINLALLLAASAASAQPPSHGPWPEIRPAVGVYVPTGAQRAEFRGATLVGAQAALQAADNLHFLIGVSWIHGHAKAPLSSDITHIWHYDGGAELNAVRRFGGGWEARPFIGAGGGVRSYNYRAETVSSTACLAGYGSLGAELQKHAIGLRFEARDYVACFASVETGKKEARNDISVALGLTFHIH